MEHLQHISLSCVKSEVFKYWRQYVPVEYDPVIGLNKALTGLTPVEVVLFALAIYYILSMIVNNLISFKSKFSLIFLKSAAIKCKFNRRRQEEGLLQVRQELARGEAADRQRAGQELEGVGGRPDEAD